MGSLLLLDGESSSTSFLNNLIMCFLNEVHKSWAHSKHKKNDKF